MCKKFPAIFVDEKGTKFEVGPHKVDGLIYEYKLTDANGVDYCDLDQMNLWGIDIKKIITE